MMQQDSSGLHGEPFLALDLGQFLLPFFFLARVAGAGWERLSCGHLHSRLFSLGWGEAGLSGQDVARSTA